MGGIRIVLAALILVGSANGREFQSMLAAEEARVIASLPVVPAGLNDAHALEIKPSKTISAIHTYDVSAPQLTAREWILFTARPPDFPGQRVLRAATSPASENVFENSPLRQAVMRARVPVTSPRLAKAVTLKTRLEAELFSRRVIHRVGESPNKPLAALPGRERQLFLRRTPQFDYTHRSLRNWMASNQLLRSNKEGEVDFARRVFLVIAKGFQYEYLGEQNRSAPHVCRIGKSDCGGLAVLFVTVLRSQGIPARTLAGRWAISATPDAKIGEVKYHQEHVKSEFFAQGVGWVPADLSSAILHDNSPGKLAYFGNDNGDFLTLHFDNELAIDTVYFGVRPMPLLQRPSYWVKGSGNVDNARIQESWNVTRTDP